jgi:hypothetical protein
MFLYFINWCPAESVFGRDTRFRLHRSAYRALVIEFAFLRIVFYRFHMPITDDSETISLRATVIGGERYPDDFEVI